MHADPVRFVAAKLSELSKLGFGKAVEMAEIEQGKFLHKPGAYGFHAINMDDEQIEAELTAAK